MVLHTADPMQDLEDLIDMEKMQFVNPYEVNPIPPRLSRQQVSANDFTMTKTKREDFEGFSALLSDDVNIVVCTDELNTPVFDKRLFEFPPPDDNRKVKVEYNPQLFGLSQNNLNNLELGSKEQSDLYKPAQSIYINGMEDSFNLKSNFKSNNTSPQDDRYSYVSSNDDPVVPDLRLDLMGEHFKFPIKEEGTLNTPDVIEEVVNMGDGFNILDLVNNEDITIISADDDLISSLTSPSLSSEPPTPQPKQRKRKLSNYDRDEDYIPPKKPSSVFSQDIDLDSSSDDSYGPKKSRGRPPKRPNSVSSDGSQDVSKYRELRDKNNEASRKSRLKRKTKELEYEKEAEELFLKNVRLKTQVEELEKMVSSFRSNLFKILVQK